MGPDGGLNTRPVAAVRGLLLVAVIAAGLLTPTTGTAQIPALPVEYGDCATVLAGPRCALRDDRRLRLWVRADPGA